MLQNSTKTVDTVLKSNIVIVKSMPLKVYPLLEFSPSQRVACSQVTLIGWLLLPRDLLGLVNPWTLYLC